MFTFNTVDTDHTSSTKNLTIGAWEEKKLHSSYIQGKFENFSLRPSEVISQRNELQIQSSVKTKSYLKCISLYLFCDRPYPLLFLSL